MLCENCKIERCDRCGQIIYPQWNPMLPPIFPDPNKVWCGDLPNTGSVCGTLNKKNE